MADRVDLLGGDDGDLGAAFAVQVFNLLVADQDVEARAVAEVDVTDQAVALEHLEVAMTDDSSISRVCARCVADTGPSAAKSASRTSRRAMERRFPPVRTAAIASARVVKESGGACGATVKSLSPPSTVGFRRGG